MTAKFVPFIKAVLTADASAEARIDAICVTPWLDAREQAAFAVACVHDAGGAQNEADAALLAAVVAFVETDSTAPLFAAHYARHVADCEGMAITQVAKMLLVVSAPHRGVPEDADWAGLAGSLLAWHQPMRRVGYLHELETRRAGCAEEAAAARQIRFVQAIIGAQSASDWRTALGIRPGEGWTAAQAYAAYLAESAIIGELTLTAWLATSDPCAGSGGVGSSYPDYEAAAVSLLAEVERG